MSTAPEPTLPDDETTQTKPYDFVTPADELVRQDRWVMAQRRWTQLFGEPRIPMPLDAAIIAVSLEPIEGMLYDKGVKNQDPARCACGCGFVIGCVGTRAPKSAKV